MSARKPKAPKKAAIPQRDGMAPWVADYSRVPWISPTDRNTGETIYDTGMTSWGRAVVKHYRPCQRDKEILQAVFASGESTINKDGSGSVLFDVAKVARLANCSDHKAWMLDALDRLAETHVTTWDRNGRKLGAFHVLAEIRRHGDGTATAYFTPGFLYGWKVQRWVHMEGLLHDLSRVTSPRVRALIQFYVTHGVDWDMTLDDALTAIRALDVAKTKRPGRRAEVRTAAKDGTLARFGLSLYKSGPGVEHVRLDRSALNADGLVQLDPPDPGAAFPTNEAYDERQSAQPSE